MSTQDVLQAYSNLFSTDDWIKRGFREFGWMVIKFLASVIDDVTTVADKLFQLDIFYNNKDVADFINGFKPVIIVLFGISFCIIGYQLMYRKREYKQIAVNFLIAVSIIVILPTAMDKLRDLTSTGVAAVQGKPQDTANEVIKSNVTDLLLYDKANFDKSSIKQLTSDNNIDKDQIRYINPVAVIEPDFFNSLGIQNQDVFKNQIDIGEDGKLTTTKLNQGWLTFWKEYYYRYDINFSIIIIALLVIGATMIFTCIKLAILIYELAFNKLLALLTAAVDISDGSKTKQVIQNILYIFVVVFLIAVLLKFYVLFVGAIGKTKGLEWLLLMIGGSIATIDGPNIVEKMFGIDAGLSNVMSTVMGGYMVGQTLAGLGKTIGNGIKTMAGAGAAAAETVAGGTAGTISGVKKGMEDKSKQDNSKNNLYDDMDKKGQENNKGPIDVDYEDVGNDNSNEDKNKQQGIYDEMNEEGNNENNTEGITSDEGQDTGLYKEMNNDSKPGDISDGSINEADGKGNLEGITKNKDQGTGLYAEMNDGNKPGDVSNENVNKANDKGNLEGITKNKGQGAGLYEEMNNGNKPGDVSDGNVNKANDKGNLEGITKNKGQSAGLYEEMNNGNKPGNVSDRNVNETDGKGNTEGITKDKGQGAGLYEEMNNGNKPGDVSDGNVNETDGKGNTEGITKDKGQGAGLYENMNNNNSGTINEVNNGSDQGITTGNDNVSENTPETIIEDGGQDTDLHEDSSGQPAEMNVNGDSGISKKEQKVNSNPINNNDNEKGYVDVDYKEVKNSSNRSPIIKSQNATNENREKETIGSYLKNRTKSKIKNSEGYKRTVKAYNLSQNTARGITHKMTDHDEGGIQDE